MLIAWLIQTLENLFSEIFLYLLILAGIVGIILIFAAHRVSFTDRRERMNTKNPPSVRRGEMILQNSRNVAGTVSALREIRPAVYGKTAFRYYEAAVTYDSDTGTKTALFGLKTEGQPLIWKEGDRLRLHLFRDPLMPSTADERIAAETAYGALPGRDLHFRELSGCALDETATVILESDLSTIKDYLSKLDMPVVPESDEAAARNHGRSFARHAEHEIVRCIRKYFRYK